MRYVDTRPVPVAALVPFPGNARIHDEAAIEESARVNGQYRSVVVRELGGEFQILAGHGTVDAFTKLGEEQLRVEVIEADDVEALRINLADNGTARNASFDETALLAQLQAAADADALPGSGWDDAELAKLLARLGDAEPPEEFQSYDEDVPTEHTCPKCGYAWSGGS